MDNTDGWEGQDPRIWHRDKSDLSVTVLSPTMNSRNANKVRMLRGNLKYYVRQRLAWALHFFKL